MDAILSVIGHVPITGCSNRAAPAGHVGAREELPFGVVCPAAIYAGSNPDAN
jgi:hypothetical protein